MNRKIFVIAIFFLIICGSTAYTYSSNSNDNKYPQGPNITSSDRVLIIAPHPDDETIACAGVIRYCVENNIHVQVVVVTNGGDGKLGNIRYHECLNSTKILGLQPSNIVFFDYTQGVESLYKTNWNRTLNIHGNHTSNFAYQQNAPYTGASLEKNMETVINDFKPTIIIYPDIKDSNPDHKGTSQFVEYATNKINYTGQKFTYLIHVSPGWPYPPLYFPQTDILPPSSMINQNWVVFPINSSDEKLKYNAIYSYKSQMDKSSIYQNYLTSFIRKNELFIKK